MKKYCNFETENSHLKEALRAFLKSIGVYYELSSCGAGAHFEILCNPDERETINGWLDINA